MIFEWDIAKSEKNKRKRGINFKEAEVAFEDFYAIEEFDKEHSTAEELRYKMIAMAETKILVVIYTMCGETYRIISARKAENYERELYERQRSENAG